MPLPISIDHPTPVVIATVFGSSFGTISVQQAGERLEAPVAFGCVRPVADYQLVVDQAAQNLLPRGAHVMAINSGTGLGDFHELPVIEVFIGSSSETVSEYLIRQGWALPDEQAYGTSLRQDAYVAALKLARVERQGVWGEKGVSAQQLGISAALDHLTAPVVPASEAISHVAFAVVIVTALALGMRERFWRAQVQAARREADTHQRPTMAQWLLRGAGFVAKSYVGVAPGLFKSVPGFAVTPAAPPSPPPAPSATPVPTRDRTRPS